MPSPIAVHIERGAKRVFATAIAWPGWSRSGTTEEEALDALLASADRYAAVGRRAKMRFAQPATVADLEVTARAAGGSGTDFGVPSVAPAEDDEPVDAADLARLDALLRAAWATFDAAAAAHRGAELRKGPRGGGRPLSKIVGHVLEAEEATCTSSATSGLHWQGTLRSPRAWRPSGTPPGQRSWHARRTSRSPIPTRSGSVEPALLRASLGVARPRPCLGDRGPRHVNAARDALLERITAWAHSRDDVRGALLVGSAARTASPADEHSDLDVVVFVLDPGAWLEDATWVQEIGEPWITFVEPTGVGHGWERRVPFADGVDVDFSLFPPPNSSVEATSAARHVHGVSSAAPAPLPTGTWGRAWRSWLRGTRSRSTGSPTHGTWAVPGAVGGPARGGTAAANADRHHPTADRQRACLARRLASHGQDPHDGHQRGDEQNDHE